MSSFTNWPFSKGASVLNNTGFRRLRSSKDDSDPKCSKMTALMMSSKTRRWRTLVFGTRGWRPRPPEPEDDGPLQPKNDGPLEHEDDSPLEPHDNGPLHSKCDGPLKPKDDGYSLQSLKITASWVSNRKIPNLELMTSLFLGNFLISWFYKTQFPQNSEDLTTVQKWEDKSWKTA